MMNGHEESDPAMVAVKLATKAERSVAESVEPRAGAEGNAEQGGTHPTLNRNCASHGLDRVRTAARSPLVAQHPRWEPYAGKPQVRICAGGAR
jgi:hypothetical protein